MVKRVGGFINQDGLNAPDEPTSVTGTSGDQQVRVSFTAPADVGGAAVTGYVATSNDGSGATGSASPITVTGLTNDTSYTFRVWAINPFGWSSPSVATGSVTPTASLGFFSAGSTANGTSTTYSNSIDVIAISSAGNATDFGDLAVGNRYSAGCSSPTLGITAGGNNNGSRIRDIQKITMATTGSGASFGDLSTVREDLGALSNSTRGVFAGGYGTALTNTVEYVTFGTSGNAVDFGDLLSAARTRVGFASPTRGIFTGEDSTNVMQYITIATTGNSTDFGDLLQAVYYPSGCSNDVRGIVAGGTDPGINVIQYVTVASTGSAIDFGDLTIARHKMMACASATRAVFGAGATTVSLNVIDYVTIATLGNAIDFGDATLRRESGSGFSNAHGGLS